MERTPRRHACITETGRVIDISSYPIREFVDGAWRDAKSPLYGEEVLNARILSEDEIKQNELYELLPT